MRFQADPAASRTDRLAAISDVLTGAPLVLVALLAAPVLRRRYNRWGASPAELAAAMPGDELVAQPRLGYTRAVHIHAPPASVWPWLAQIGHGRGGLYSYDGLENLVGCRMRSADGILAEHQQLRPGDLIRLGPAGYPCFRVEQVAAPATLVLLSVPPDQPAKPAAHKPVAHKPVAHKPATHTSAARTSARHAEPPGLATWQWQLHAEGADRTRLVVRQRLAFADRQALLWHLVEPVTFVMEHRMLHGLKRRAEASRAEASRTEASRATG